MGLSCLGDGGNLQREEERRGKEDEKNRVIELAFFLIIRLLLCHGARLVAGQ